METLIWEKQGPIGILSFHRPQALNAINGKMLDELSSWLGLASQDKSLRVVILTGAGEKAFVAGADIKEMSSFTTTQARVFAEKAHKILLGFQNLKVPVIAAVNGFALGGGCEVAMAADIIIASDHASFGLPEVTLGLIPGFGGTQRLPKFVGISRAAEIIFTGRKYTAHEALSFGLVSTVYPKAELLDAAKKLALEISSRGPLAVAAAKRSIANTYHLPLSQGLIKEAEEFSLLFASRDQKEGTTAFIQKRAPNFTGD